LEEIVRPEVIDLIEAAEDNAFLYGGLVTTGRQLLDSPDPQVKRFRGLVQDEQGGMDRLPGRSWERHGDYDG
jgi:hypothetical protein